MEEINPSLARELLAMEAQDLRVAAELARDGSLYEGYHPRMREVHDRNAARLAALWREHGWPGRSLVGEEASRAAWRILQHAIAQPELMREGLALLQETAARGQAGAVEAAMLDDRIRTLEGRPQRYGTQFDWDEQGQVSPLPIDDAAEVDRRRARLGLAPLAEATGRLREGIGETGEEPPRDWGERQRQFEAWAREVGWRR